MTKPNARSAAGVEALVARLEEAESTLAAIRQGDVDALVLSAPTEIAFSRSRARIRATAFWWRR